MKMHVDRFEKESQNLGLSINGAKAVFMSIDSHNYILSNTLSDLETMHQFKTSERICMASNCMTCQNIINGLIDRSYHFFKELDF